MHGRDECVCVGMAGGFLRFPIFPVFHSTSTAVGILHAEVCVHLRFFLI